MLGIVGVVCTVRYKKMSEVAWSQVVVTIFIYYTFVYVIPTIFQRLATKLHCHFDLSENTKFYLLSQCLHSQNGVEL